MSIRVAATFNSPRFKYGPGELYEQLRTMTVTEIDGISSVLEIPQNGQKVQVKVATASEHIEDASERLTIYVPKERRAQELCFGSVLPQKFAAWLMRHPTSHIDGAVEVDAVNALTSIFACDQSVLDDILDDQGIIQVPFEHEDENDDDGEEEEHEQQQSDNPFETDDASSEQQMTPTHSSVNGSSSQYVGSSDAESERGLTETVVETISRQSHNSRQSRSGDGHDSIRPVLVHHSSRSPSTSSYQAPQYLSPALAIQSESRSSEDAQYLTILNRVVNTARSAAFPSRGAFGMSDLLDALSGIGNADAYESFDGLDLISRFRSTNQLERDKKVGAAGELYVSIVACIRRVFKTD